MNETESKLENRRKRDEVYDVLIYLKEIVKY